MAAGTIAAPGTEHGPCLDEKCGHWFCEATRREYGAVCRFCSKEIGANTRFYTEQGNGTLKKQMVHAICYELAVERGEE